MSTSFNSNPRVVKVQEPIHLQITSEGSSQMYRSGIKLRDSLPIWRRQCAANSVSANLELAADEVELTYLCLPRYLPKVPFDVLLAVC
jgi:hypothetical protein